MTVPEGGESGRPDQTPDTPKLLSVIPFWTILTAIIAPGAFLVGNAYYDGYLSAFGVSGDDLPIDTVTTYVHAYDVIGVFLITLAEKMIGHMGEYLWWVIFAVLGYGLMLGLVVIGSRRYSAMPSGRGLKSILQKWHPKNNDVAAVSLVTGLLTYLVAAAFVFVVMIAFFWVVIPESARQQGAGDADKRIALLKAKGCHYQEADGWSNCVVVAGDKGKVLYKGLLVGANEKNIILYTSDGARILPRKENMHLLHKRTKYPWCPMPELQ